MFGLVRVESRGGARRFHGAEAAAARAGVAHEHDGGGGGRFVAAAPAVRDVGAAGFFADGVEVEAAEVGSDFLVVGVVGDGRLEPGGKAGDGFLFAGGADERRARFDGWVGGGRCCGRGDEFGEGGAGVQAVLEGCWAAAGGGGICG